jgi:predicted phosphodiesterase/DNA-binding transcriptional regulator YdaS (Cro superfamily)
LIADPWYRDRDQLLAAITEAGGVRRAADAQNVSAETLSKWVGRLGLRDEVAAIRSPAAVRAVSGTVSHEEVLEQELREARSIISAQHKDAVLDERVMAEVRRHVSAITPRYKPAPFERGKTRTPHTHFLQWSDIHATEVVDYDQMNGLNAFNWDIMLGRHERMRQAMLSFKDNRPYPVEKLVIGAIGDMLTGDIHDELRETNEKVLTEATFQLAHDMGDWIETFVEEYPSIMIRCTFGNHGRLTKKPSFKNAFHNWDWMFYKTLQLRLSKYESIDFEVTKAAQVPFMIYDKRILLWHGDGVRSAMTDVPWGGIMRYCKKLSDTWRMMNQPIDHFAIGHWHESNQIRGGWILMNGSIKGPDEYGFARFGGGQPAQQVLATFHPKRGLTETCLLDLQS